jgi:hypothetical protein
MATAQFVCGFQSGADANRNLVNRWTGSGIPHVAGISRAMLASKETIFRFGILIIRGRLIGVIFSTVSQNHHNFQP